MVPGAGADELIRLVTTAAIGPGDAVVIPTPTFAMFAVEARAGGCPWRRRAPHRPGLPPAGGRDPCRSGAGIGAAGVALHAEQPDRRPLRRRGGSGPGRWRCPRSSASTRCISSSGRTPSVRSPSRRRPSRSRTSCRTSSCCARSRSRTGWRVPARATWWCPAPLADRFDAIRLPLSVGAPSEELALAALAGEERGARVAGWRSSGRAIGWRPRCERLGCRGAAVGHELRRLPAGAAGCGRGGRGTAGSRRGGASIRGRARWRAGCARPRGWKPRSRACCGRSRRCSDDTDRCGGALDRGDHDPGPGGPGRHRPRRGRRRRSASSTTCSTLLARHALIDLEVAASGDVARRRAPHRRGHRARAWVAPSTRPSASARGSAGTATCGCRWTRPWPCAPSTSVAGPTPTSNRYLIR